MALPACKPIRRLEIGFRKRQNPFAGKSYLWDDETANLGISEASVASVARMTRHCVGFRARTLPTAYSRKSSTWGKGKWAIRMVDRMENCRASQAPCHFMICCAFNHIRKTQDEATLWSRIVYHLKCYTQYRVIQQATTKGIVEVPFLYNCISYIGIYITMPSCKM